MLGATIRFDLLLHLNGAAPNTDSSSSIDSFGPCFEAANVFLETILRKEGRKLKPSLSEETKTLYPLR